MIIAGMAYKKVIPTMLVVKKSSINSKKNMMLLYSIDFCLMVQNNKNNKIRLNVY
jgi:hypothetical protein